MKLKFFAVIIATLFLAACSKITMENYNQLKSGMKYEAVVEIIGQPESCDEKFGTRSCIWGETEGTNITANFLSGTAIFFSHTKLK